MAQHTNPLTGARYPDNSSATDLGTYYAWAVNDLSPQSVPPFATAAARDTAYSNWVAAGNTMRDGLVCTVGGILQQYRNSQWRGVLSTSASQQTFFATTISTTAETGVATLSIPDPGWPYILDVSACVQVASTAGVQVAVRVRLDSVTGTQVSQTSYRSGALPAGEIIMVPLGTFPSGTLTGAHSLVCSAQMTAGSGNWNVPATGSLLNAIIRPSFA